MQVNRPMAIVASLTTASIGGAIGSVISNRDSAGSFWVFLGLIANFLFQVYRDHKQRRYMREDQERQMAREKRMNEELTKKSEEIKAAMRTRLSDFSKRLDKMVEDSEGRLLRRSQDEL